MEKLFLRARFGWATAEFNVTFSFALLSRRQHHTNFRHCVNLYTTWHVRNQTRNLRSESFHAFHSSRRWFRIPSNIDIFIAKHWSLIQRTAIINVLSFLIAISINKMPITISIKCICNKRNNCMVRTNTYLTREQIPRKERKLNK